MGNSDKIYQIKLAIDKLDKILEQTDWSMLFPNTDDTVVFIEAKAKVLEGKKKFEKIVKHLEKG